MDSTVNDGLYHWFLKSKLKCENIYDCELVMFLEFKKCQKIVARSDECGVDQHVSWCLPGDELNLDTIWSKYDDFCKSKQMK